MKRSVLPLWRVNYGNGQVSGRMSQHDARRLLAQCDGFAFLQQDIGIDAPDGWVRA